MHTLLLDLRFCFRMLSRNRGFTLVAIIALSLGIGANTAIFSVVNAVLLRPLPWEKPDRLVMLWEAKSQPDADQELVTGDDLTLWKDQQQLFERVAFWPALP